LWLGGAWFGRLLGDHRFYNRRGRPRRGAAVVAAELGGGFAELGSSFRRRCFFNDFGLEGFFRLGHRNGLFFDGLLSFFGFFAFYSFRIGLRGFCFFRLDMILLTGCGGVCAGVAEIGDDFGDGRERDNGRNNGAIARENVRFDKQNDHNHMHNNANHQRQLHGAFDHTVRDKPKQQHRPADA